MPKPKKGEKLTHLAPFQFKRGKSGNPTGRPVRKPLLKVLKQVLEDNPDLLRDIAEIALAKAASGNEKMFAEVRDMLDGKPAQAIVAGTDDEGNVMPAPVVNVNFVAAPKELKKK